MTLHANGRLSRFQHVTLNEELRSSTSDYQLRPKELLQCCGTRQQGMIPWLDESPERNIYCPEFQMHEALDALSERGWDVVGVTVTLNGGRKVLLRRPIEN